MNESPREMVSVVESQLKTLTGRLVTALGNASPLCDILVLQFAAPNCSQHDFALFVDCAWRLERGDAILAGSADGDPNSGETKTLIGRTLIDAEVSAPAADVRLFFTDGVLLRLFSTRNDVSEEEDEFTHWRLYGPQKYCLAVGPGMQYRLNGRHQGEEDECY